MKSSVILVAVLLLSLGLLIGSASAVSVDIMGLKTKTIQYGQSTRFDFTIKNNINRMMDYVIVIEGAHPEWVTLDKYFFFVPSLSQKKLDVVVFPQDNGTQSYSLIVQSISTPGIYNSFDFSVKAVGNKRSEVVVEEKKTSIERVDSGISGDNIETTIVVKKPDDTAITVDFYLKDSEGNIFSTYSKTLEGEGSQSVSHKFPTTNLLAGRYVIEAVVRELLISKSSIVVIPESRDVKKTRKVTSGFLYETVTIFIENLGNVVESEYILTDSVPSSESVSWDVSPSSQQVFNGNVLSTWIITNLRPSDKVFVSYTINYWFSVLKIIIAIILILVAIAIVYMKMSRPSISKRFIKKGVSHFLVILEVKGSFFAPIRSVLVKDSISPLMEVQGKFEGIAPVIRKGKEKTELLWRIGTMKRMDERILSYNIKGKVEAQIKLEPAMLRYKKTEEGEKRRVLSNMVHVE